MVKILCKGTLLKDDDIRLDMIMQCPANISNRENLSTNIAQICPEIDYGEYFGVLLGNSIDGWSFDDMEPMWRISSRHI